MEEVVPVPMTGIQPRRLVALSEEECWEHLGSGTVGRIAWSGAEGVSVVPVNFAVEDRAILIRTTPYSLMARDCSARGVAFEVDAFDDATHTGWSVLVRGRCERQERSGDAPLPWATGSRVLGLRITASVVTGRRLVIPGAERS
ncbi:MAG TPA: pyridoxamine 5'-phosphate oxidase family protein [Nocardioides sp.]|nr:pyridoxamine 5'-phosphate oxidase family protein [Nocardioides sp.]